MEKKKKQLKMLEPEKIVLTREQSERFATDWLKTKLNEINDIVKEIQSKIA